MKKDENIKKMLGQLSDAQDAPKPELLLPALDQLRRQKSVKAGGAGDMLRGRQPVAAPANVAAIAKKKRIRIAAVIALIAILAVATAIAVPQILSGITNSRTFDLNALETSNDVTISQKELFPVLNHSTGDAVAAEYTVFSKGGNTVAVQYKARRLTKYSIDDIIIIAETGKYFVAEYRSYAENTAYTKYGNKYRYDSYYEGGEYCSEYYTSAGGFRYYISITSPNNKSDSYYYLDKLLKNF